MVSSYTAHTPSDGIHCVDKKFVFGNAPTRRLLYKDKGYKFPPLYCILYSN